jgi:hypothetical protein
MDTRKILEQLRSEQERINKAIQALEGLDSGASRSSYSAGRRRRRRLSAEARRRISLAQKKRWAAQKKQSSS